MCSVAGAPILEFWSNASTRLPLRIRRIPSQATFYDISAAGSGRPWYRVAAVSASFGSGTAYGARAVHPAFVTVTSGAIRARVVAAFPPAGICPTGAAVDGFDPE